MVPVVARYRDGRLVKGTTINFSPDAWHCHVQPPGEPYGEGTRVDFHHLKALFFVHSLEGNPYHEKARDAQPKARFAEPVRVRFQDGEEITGLAHLYQHEPGFFIYPADPEGNNERIFAIRDYVEWVEPAQGGAAIEGGEAVQGGEGGERSGAPDADTLRAPTIGYEPAPEEVQGSREEGEEQGKEAAERRQP